MPLRDRIELESGRAMHALIEELYPICRSISGRGVRRTLEILERLLPQPLMVSEVPSGTKVLDWTVPNEWNIEDAWIKNEQGDRVVDFRASNLHVVSYSAPTRIRLSLAELQPRLHTLPHQPDLVPYRTSYYEETWGFCLSERQRQSLPDGMYDIGIDSTLELGSLTYGELVLPGSSNDEILISTHVCHPSLCDDNLSGIAVSVFLARELARCATRRHTLRFLYVPGTIGAIAWLARNRERLACIRHGLTLSCLGGARPLAYKRTVFGEAEIDRAAAQVLESSGLAHQVIDFTPYGYDERQYNSPGFRLPVGALMRGRPGEFDEYHTSADDLTFISAPRLAESLAVCRAIVEVLDGNRAYRNLAPEGEPQLGARGLYRAIGGTGIADRELAMLWVLNLSDGTHTLLDIARRAQLDFATVRAAADLLLQHALIA